MTSVFVQGAVAAAVFVGLAIVWTFPLATHFTTHIPGAGAGDNVAVLWNFWWARFANGHDLPLLQTGYLFAPEGTSLALHTHVALPAMLGATLLGSLPLVAAHNVLLLATIALNGWSAFWLIRQEARDWVAALVGGAIFAGSPFVVAHLHGHFSVLCLWTLPLVALAARAAMSGSRPAAAGFGALVGLTAYLDYYFAVYAVALAGLVCLLEGRRVSMTWSPPSPPSTADRALLAALVLVAGTVVGISATGGGRVTVGGLVVGLNDTFNGRQVAWLLTGLWAWRRWRPRVSLRADERPILGGAIAPEAPVASTWPTVWPPALLAGVCALVVAAPLLLRVVQLMAAGDYVSQVHQWRSGAQGVDLATLLLGPPTHWLGDWSRALYERLGIDWVERSAWLGLVPPALAITAVRRHLDAAARRWAAVALLAFLWALGPHLTVFGRNTAMILPNALLRYLPVLSNARIPGRAMALVALAVAVLAGLGLARLRRRERGSLVTIAACLLLAGDLAPGRFPLTALDHPAIYDAIAADAPGAVLELPLGIRDGFGESGTLDHRTLWYQSIHERPLIGGFVARLSPSTRRSHESDPLLDALLTLSTRSAPSAPQGPAPLAPPDPAVVSTSLRRLGIDTVVLNRRTASPALVEWVKGLPLTLTASDDERDLYRVTVER